MRKRSTLCFTILGLAGIIALLTGCCASYVVPKPGTITLQEAMKSLGEGFRQLKEGEGDLRTGLVADEVEVTFNISASGEQGGKLYVEVSPIPIGATPIQGKVGGEYENKYKAQRGNQITVKFKNILFADPSKTAMRDPETTKRFLEIIKGNAVFFMK